MQASYQEVEKPLEYTVKPRTRAELSLFVIITITPPAVDRERPLHSPPLSHGEVGLMTLFMGRTFIHKVILRDSYLLFVPSWLAS